MITLNNSLWSLALINCSNQFRGRAKSHCKASFIKIPDIIFVYAVFLNSGLYSLEPQFNNPWIFLLCALICHLSCISRMYLGMVLKI